MSPQLTAHPIVPIMATIVLNQEKTRPIDTFSLASVPHAKRENARESDRGSEYDLIYAQDSLVFQSITLSPADVLTIRRENAGLSIEELSKLSGIPADDIACMKNSVLPIDTQSAQKLALALACECSDFAAQS